MSNQTITEREVQLIENEAWSFPNGIPGFPEEKEFVLHPIFNQESFFILQSKEKEEVAFIVTNPFEFYQDYDFTLDENSLAVLELINEEDVVVLVIVTLRDSLENSTVNLQAPIILNKRNYKGKQVILNNSPYRTRHNIITKQK
ncbi:flagellar assembly protein FliW [Bacillus sp. AGMB 02131]|uniref:Flagellar assembly factor FliW n=1 Tax=Peribacillus faecalis TaxID=2772559 RepID=A0A927CVW6_9BACI|nr:flagellar assembly protein FliW [Peribacillus faecalis]MBD3108496.1 flagellar assembly protein FliW [Peribacillus faecalis]